MKRLIAIILIMALAVPAFALSETNTTDSIQLFPGVWTIGKDIPEGDWIIEPVSVHPRWHYVTVTYCNRLDESKTRADNLNSEIFSFITLTFETFQMENMYPTSINIHCEEGRYIIVEDGIVVFKPYIEKETVSD